MSDRQSIIYALSDPRTGNIRYVGKTNHSIATRISEHIYNAKRKRNHVYNWVRSLSICGLRPVGDVLEVIPAFGDWQLAERKWIAYFRKLGCALVNGTDGGEGTVGRQYVASPETRAKLSAAGMGRRPSKETLEKRSESLRAFYSDAEQMEKRRAIARAAGRSLASIESARARMKATWADPVKAAEMRRRMKGVKKNAANRMLPAASESKIACSS